MKPTDAELSAFLCKRLDSLNGDHTKINEITRIIKDAIDFFDGSPKEIIAWLELQADAATPHPFPDGKYKTIIPCPEREVFDNFKIAAQLIKRFSNNVISIEPVHVNEKPWNRQGWCDKDGKCWLISGNINNLDYSLSYSNYKVSENYPKLYTHLLPHYAINVPKL